MTKPFARVWMLISRIPLPRTLMPRDVSMPSGRDMIVFPIAGAILAFVALLPAWAASLALPTRPCAWMATALYLIAGWSLHVDGLGDLCDGLGSGKRGEDMRRVMKDARVGAFAVCGIVVSLALRSELLACIDVSMWPAACAVSGGVGRFAACVAAYRGTYPWGAGGISASIVEGIGAREIAAAFALTIVFAAASPLAWAMGVALSSLVGAFLSHVSERTLGGTNGDVLGAASVVGELSVLAVCAVISAA